VKNGGPKPDMETARCPADATETKEAWLAYQNSGEQDSEPGMGMTKGMS